MSGIPITKWQVRKVAVEDRAGRSVPLGWMVMRTMSDGTAEIAGPGSEVHFATDPAAAQALADQLNAERQREVASFVDQRHPVPGHDWRNYETCGCGEPGCRSYRPL